jgi:hypothetical protein
MRVVEIFLAVTVGVMLMMGAATAALAQDVSDYVKITPRPDWIVPVDAPIFDANIDAGRETVFPLIDYQNRHTATTDEYSYRYVVDLLTPAAVDDEGTLSIDFDPSYRSMQLHHVRIIRDGETIDAADLNEAMVFRTETDRDQMIFNGTLTFLLPILDLRVGDRLDVAYTRSGRREAIGTGFLIRRTFATTSEIKRRFLRVSIARGLDIYTQTHNDPPEPERMIEDEWTVFQWDAPDPEAPAYDSDSPSWSFVRPSYEISNFESWAQVGNLFHKYYIRTDDDRDAVREIADEIAAEHVDAKARARAALDWVQSHIRYVGLELGEGGFVPRPPDRVLRRRFGDCKDVTMLLLTLLDELGVLADPMLVDLNERGGEFKGLANPYAFDHIMVLAEIDGALYPLDATRDPQIGTLDTMEKGDIDFGLRLRDGASVVTKLPLSDYEARELITERFDLVAEPGVILYSINFREYGEDADNTLAWIARDGEDDVINSFVEYLSDIYPTLEPDGDLSWSSDDEEGWSELRMSFRLSGYTADDRRSLNTRAYQILAAMPDFEGGERTSPFSIKHPRNIRHIIEYIADDRYSFNDEDKTVETDAFRYVYKTTVADNVLREVFHWTTKQGHIDAKDFAKDMASISEIRDWNYTTINLPFDEGGDVAMSRSTQVLAWLFLIAFPLTVLSLIWRSKKRSQIASSN